MPAYCTACHAVGRHRTGTGPVIVRTLGNLDRPVVVQKKHEPHARVASEQHRARTHPLGRIGNGERRPAEAVVVLD